MTQKVKTMDRSEFGRLLNSVVISEGTSAEEMMKTVMPIREAISEMMPEQLFRFGDKQVER